MLKGK